QHLRLPADPVLGDHAEGISACGFRGFTLGARVYAVGDEAPRVFPLLSSACQRYRRVDAQTQQLLPAGDAVLQPPPGGAWRVDEQIHPVAIGKLAARRVFQGGADCGVCERQGELPPGAWATLETTPRTAKLSTDGIGRLT